MHPFLPRKRRGGKRKADFPPVLPSWPVALRKVRSWLEPYVMLVRYWRAFSDLCPRPRSYESCLRGCSPERAFTSMSADNKLPLQRFAMVLTHRDPWRMGPLVGGLAQTLIARGVLVQFHCN